MSKKNKFVVEEYDINTSNVDNSEAVANNNIVDNSEAVINTSNVDNNFVVANTNTVANHSPKPVFNKINNAKMSVIVARRQKRK